jgi:hypothetical protein
MRSTRTLLLLTSLIALTVCSGCQQAVTLHPVTTGDANSIDIQRIPAGSTFKAPAGKSGWWFSDDYTKEVMRVKLGK